MSCVYELWNNNINHSCFVERYENLNDLFVNNYKKWKCVDLFAYNPILFELVAGDNNKKNYKFDFSIQLGFIVFSEKAKNVLEEILNDYGQFLPIVTESKRKNFYGFYPNKNVYGDEIINFEKSDWRKAKKGIMINKLVLNNKYPKDDYMFTLQSIGTSVYVTEKFKELVEKHDLKGFDFSEQNLIEVMG